MLRFFFILLISFKINAHHTCKKDHSDDNNPYKIHMFTEVPISTEVLPFQFTVVGSGVTVYAEIENALTFSSGNVLKDRHGQPVSVLTDHIAIFIYDGHTEQEITGRILIKPTAPDELTYDVTTYYRLKGDPRNYSNDPVEVFGRWNIICIQA